MTFELSTGQIPALPDHLISLVDHFERSHSKEPSLSLLGSCLSNSANLFTSPRKHTTPSITLVFDLPSPRNQ